MSKPLAPKLMDDVAILLERTSILLKNVKKEQAPKKSCSICGKTPIHYRGLCEACFLGERKKKEEKKKGKVWTSTNGYVYTYDDDLNVTLYGRFLMEQKLKRKLERYEIISYRDGDKTNCNIDNLFLALKQGTDLSTIKCKNCGHHLSD